MSKDKYQAKRMYKGRGANTKRKRRQVTGSGGKKTKPGTSLVVFCQECPKGTSSISVSSDTREVRCKLGHLIKVGSASHLTECEMEQSL
jgi:hypothetical protein